MLNLLREHCKISKPTNACSKS